MAFTRKEKVRVVIIGGGLAGLSAANTLLQYNETFQCTLLEADDCLGGRVKTLNFPEPTNSTCQEIALGSAYFHGTEGNSIYHYYHNKCNIDHCNDIKYPIEDITVKCIFSDGTSIPAHIVNEIQTCYDTLQEKDILLNSPLAKESLYDYLHANFLPKLKDIVTRHKLTYDVMSLFEGFLAFDSINEGSKYVRDVQCSSVVDWEYLEGGECLFVTGNPYQRVIDALTSSLPPNIIHLNSPVSHVDWSNTKGLVSVTVSDGTVYNADHVIVTISLGALKQAICNDLFFPSLPFEKHQAIEKLGFGLINKLILQFKAPLDDNSNEYFTVRIHWTSEDKESPLLQTHPWLSGLHYIEAYPTQSSQYHYYTGWLCGEDASAVEQIPRETLKQVLHEVCKRAFGQESPNLLDVRVSCWSKGFSYGSYSYTPARECSNSLREDLARPLDSNKVLFAGEATCNEQYSCAHPAYDTGVKVAQNIINYYCY